jgi:hypothetical protein
MWQVTVDVHSPTHRHGDHYFDNKQGQHAMDTSPMSYPASASAAPTRWTTACTTAT